jgi:hypothetical protein
MQRMTFVHGITQPQIDRIKAEWIVSNITRWNKNSYLAKKVLSLLQPERAQSALLELKAKAEFTCIAQD